MKRCDLPIDIGWKALGDANDMVEEVRAKWSGTSDVFLALSEDFQKLKLTNPSNTTFPSAEEYTPRAIVTDIVDLLLTPFTNLKSSFNIMIRAEVLAARYHLKLRTPRSPEDESLYVQKSLALLEAVRFIVECLARKLFADESVKIPTLYGFKESNLLRTELLKLFKGPLPPSPSPDFDTLRTRAIAKDFACIACGSRERTLTLDRVSWLEDADLSLSEATDLYCVPCSHRRRSTASLLLKLRGTRYSDLTPALKARLARIVRQDVAYNDSFPHAAREQCGFTAYKPPKGSGQDVLREWEWQRIKFAQDGRCNACGRREELQRDHIKPRRHGGTHDRSNIQGLCVSCNGSKLDRTWQSFLFETNFFQQTDLRDFWERTYPRPHLPTHEDTMHHWRMYDRDRRAFCNRETRR
jgi:hypothetical protein